MPIPIGALDTAGVNRLLANSPTIVTPTIASFINAQHNHQNAAGGGSLDAAAIGSGKVALANGGTGVDLSATGGSTQVLAQNASHVISARALIAADIPNLPASIITSGQLALARGGVGADLSATGGSNQFLKQTSPGGVVTVAIISSADLTTALTTPPAIGGTTPASAEFTTISASGLTTLGAAGASTAQLNVNPSSSTKGVIIRAAAMTPGDQFETQQNDGQVQWSITASGQLVVSNQSTITAPTNGTWLNLAPVYVPVAGEALTPFAFTPTFNSSTNNTARMFALAMTAVFQGTANYANTQRAISFGFNHQGSGTITQAIAADITGNNSSTGTITTSKGINVTMVNGGGGAVGTMIGIDIAAIPTSGVTTGIALRTSTGLVSFGDNVQLADAKNLVFGTTTGTQIGTVGGASGQKIGIWGKPPIVQPVLATGASHTVDDVITVLQNIGLVRQS